MCDLQEKRDEVLALFADLMPERTDGTVCSRRIWPEQHKSIVSIDIEVDRNEYKRKQALPALHITSAAFGVRMAVPDCTKVSAPSD